METQAAPPAARVTSVLAVHGNGGGAVRFERIVGTLPGGVHLTAAELPGFDGRPLPEGVIDLDSFVQPIVEQLRALPRPRVLLGHGIGGSLALELVQRFSGEVDGLILHAPVGADLDTRRFPKLMRPRIMRWLVQRALASRLLRPLWRRRLFAGERVPQDRLDRFFVGYRDCAAFGVFFDLLTARWFDSLVPVAMPSWLLWGARERVLAPSHAEAFRRLLPGAEVRVEEGWDHFPMLVQPDDYARVVAEMALELGARSDRVDVVGGRTRGKGRRPA